MNPYIPANGSENFPSYSFLLQIINNISDPIFVKNRQHQWIFINNAFCQLTGYPSEELIGKSEHDFFNPEQADMFVEKDESIFTSGISRDDEGYFTDAQGKVYIVSTQKSLFCDELGNKYLIGNIQKIKFLDNKKLEDEPLNLLPESVVKVIGNLLNISDFDKSLNAVLVDLATATNTAKVSIIADSENKKLSQNKKYTQRLEWSNNDIKTQFNILPQWHKSLIKGETISSSINDFSISEEEILKAGNIGSILVIPIQVAGEFWGYIRFDNYQAERQWLESEKSLLQTVAECVGKAFSQYQLHKKLIKNKNFLQLVVDSIPQVIFWKDCNSVFLGCNKRLADIWGLNSAEEVAGKTDDDIGTPKDKSDWYRQWDKRVIESGIPELHIIEKKEKADGTAKWLDTNKIPLRDEEGNIVGVLATIEDITHLKQTEKALKTAYEEMELLVLERTKELTKTNQALKAEIEERKNTEAALNETEAKVQKLAANVPGMLYQFELHPNGSMYFPYVSSGCNEIYGLQPEQIQADVNSIHSIFHPNDLKYFKTSCEISAKSLQPWEYEGRIILPEGETKWIKSSSRPERLEDGTIRWHGFILDVTSRKQAEKALLRSNAMLQAQQEAAIDGILVVDENQNILSCNQRFVELWQIPSSVIASRDEKQFLASIIEKFTNLAEFVNEIENLHNDLQKSIRDEIDLGDGRTFEGYCAPINSLKGEHFGRVWYFRDITERKKAEAQLRQQTQELEKALVQLKRTQVQLIQSEKMSSLGQLVAGIAHEINNPVNFIDANLAYTQQYFEDLLQLINIYQSSYQDNSEAKNFINEIEFDYLQEDFPKIINSMKAGAKRIGDIVLSLRTFSRLDEAELKEVDIHTSLDSTLMILQNSLEAQPHRNAIIVTKEFDNLPLVECYAGKLNQVFLNILNNSIDAVEEAVKNKQFLENESPQINISTKLINQHIVKISIRDNGSGIPEENISKLFDPFFTTKPVGKGTGLGLSMSYQIIVEQHEGELNCISTLGKGTEFQIYIPVTCKNILK